MTDITSETPSTDTPESPVELRRPKSDSELLALDVLLVDEDELELRLAGTKDVVLSPHEFATGCSTRCTVRLNFFRGGVGSVTLEGSSQTYHDRDGDGIVELELESPGEHTLVISCRPAPASAQKDPQVPTTKVVLRPDVNCPQPKEVP